MNKKFLYTVVLLSFIFTSFIFYNENNFPKDGNPVISNAKINGNNISTYFQNNGAFNRDPLTGNGAFEWPTGSAKFLRYASGLWLGAKIGNDTLIAVTQYTSEYLPGFINKNGVPEGKDDPDFKVYIIVKGDTLNKDYLNWPVSQGAYLDSLGKPIMPGTQTIFYSYTDGYPESHTNNGGSTAPLKAQVQVTTWCYNDYPPTEMRNVLFSEFKIINKNSLPWIDSYFTIWSDDTQNEFIAIGSDSIMNLVYSYCSPNSYQYGSNPPSFAFLLLKGPEVYTGNLNDTVYSFIPGQSQRKAKVGYKELKLTSTHAYTNADPVNGDPNSYKETYLTMQGFRRNGTNWINPITNKITKFPYSGDPESGTGWNQFTLQGFGNRRLQMDIGKLNLNPSDTQSIVIAQIVSQGTTNLNSVTKLKQSAEYVQNVFDNNFSTVGIDPIPNSVPSEFDLHQNYPNPFNPNTVISYELRVTSNAKLKVFDVLGNEVAELVNEKQSAGSYKIEFDGSNFASGVYFYKLDAGDFSETKRMILLK